MKGFGRFESWDETYFHTKHREPRRTVLEYRQGFFRFKPGGTKLKFLRSTDNITWGFGISEEGLVFGSRADVTTRDLIEQTAEGSLILGFEGERIVKNFEFYSAFASHREYAILHSGRLIRSAKVDSGVTGGAGHRLSFR